jgi:hypothetical protein
MKYNTPPAIPTISYGTGIKALNIHKYSLPGMAGSSPKVFGTKKV